MTRAVEDAQTRIRLAVRDLVFDGAPWGVIEESVFKIIKKTTKSLTADFQHEAAVSLWRFARRVYIELKTKVVNPILVGAMFALLNNRADNQQKALVKAYAKKVLTSYETDRMGLPTRESMASYMNNRVKPIMRRLSEIKAKSGNISLRAKAEMQARYEAHTQNMEELRARGVRLVVVSSHADCSARCFPWQGRVYSLDHTSGKTEDGRKFVPIENATDVYYTTKTGKRYKNGLFGFNCRHYAKEYIPFEPVPVVSRAKAKREYAITVKQRELELKVLSARERAVLAVTPEEKKHWKRIAQEWNTEYVRFSKANNRAFYPERTKIL